MPLQILTVQWKMRVFNQETLGTRHWATWNGSAQELGSEMAQTFFPSWLPILGADAEILELLVSDLLDPVNYYYTVFDGLVGTATTQTLAAFASVGGYMPVGTPFQRGASNRISGITEGQVLGDVIGVPWDQVWEGIFQIFSSILAPVLEEYWPVLVQDDGTNYILHLLVQAVLKGLTTQNSRKTGTESTVSFSSGLSITTPPNPTPFGDIAQLKNALGASPPTANTTMFGNAFPFLVPKPINLVVPFVPPA